MAFTWAVFFKLLSGECQLDSAAMIIGLQPLGMALMAGIILKEQVSKQAMAGFNNWFIGLISSFV